LDFGWALPQTPLRELTALPQLVGEADCPPPQEPHSLLSALRASILGSMPESFS